jgi:hypothetical protein
VTKILLCFWLVAGALSPVSAGIEIVRASQNACDDDQASVAAAVDLAKTTTVKRLFDARSITMDEVTSEPPQAATGSAIVPRLVKTVAVLPDGTFVVRSTSSVASAPAIPLSVYLDDGQASGRSKDVVSSSVQP